MTGPVWEERPRESAQDILAEERVRPRRLWWPGNWFVGRAGLVFLAVFVAVGLGWAVFSRMGPGDVRPAVPGNVFPGDHPEAGRGLTVQEGSAAARYGVPLFLGDGGLPVVRMAVTDEVRELTPVEMEFESALPFVSAGHGSVVWNPGPRGWGMWWVDDTERRELRPDVSFSRVRWWRKQQEELRLATAEVSNGLRLVRSMDFEVWREGIGPELAARVAGLKSRYPVTRYGHWGAVPLQWVCDSELESDLNQGLTQGCPGGPYMEVLGDAWTRLGAVVELLDGMGRLGAEMDAMRSHDLYQSDLLLMQVYALADLMGAVEELTESLDILWDETGARGLPVAVRLFSEG